MFEFYSGFFGLRIFGLRIGLGLGLGLKMWEKKPHLVKGFSVEVAAKTLKARPVKRAFSLLDNHLCWKCILQGTFSASLLPPQLKMPLIGGIFFPHIFNPNLSPWKIFRTWESWNNFQTSYLENLRRL